MNVAREPIDDADVEHALDQMRDPGLRELGLALYAVLGEVTDEAYVAAEQAWTGTYDVDYDDETGRPRDNCTVAMRAALEAAAGLSA